jgi:hypothetical protein
MAVAVLTVHSVLLLYSERRNFVTADEFGHLAAGLSYWDTGSFGIYRVNPPMPQMIAVLPVLAARPKRDYRQLQLADVPGQRSEWFVGQDFLVANEARYFDLVCRSRLSGIMWSVLGAVIVFRWAQELNGRHAAFVALVMWCFGPNVLAHAQLMTPDIPAASAAVAASYAFWHYLRRPSLRLACLCGTLLGIAQLTKFTLLVLYCVWPVLALLAFCVSRHQGWSKGWVVHAVAIGLVSVLVINAGYAFSGTLRTLQHFRFVSKTMAGEMPGEPGGYRNGHFGNRFEDSWLGWVPVPLPADYVLGIDLQRRDFELGAPSYLAGTWKFRGWWYYYLYALAVKVPLGFWAVGLWGMILSGMQWVRSTPADRIANLCVLLPGLAIVILVSSQTGFNHHLRYVLPAIPFLIVGASKAGVCLCCTRLWSKLAFISLLAWGVLSSLMVYPCSLSYFNELIGGPANGHRHLVNSNVDWGQDAIRLKEWMDENPQARPLRLAYFNFVDPRVIGLEYTLLEPGPSGIFRHDPEYGRHLGPQPGYVAISVNFLEGMPWRAPDGRGGSRPFAAQDFAYMRHFQPIAMAGYSIFIYYISPEEADRIRQELGLCKLSDP